MSPAGPGSDFNRLERILELVTEHERVYREQDIRLADIVQKVADLEVRSKAEWAPLLPLKERNVAMELDLARTAVETVVQQLAAVNKANQALQVELRSCQQKQAAQQASFESTIAVLQADLAALRSRVDDVQSNTHAAVDQFRASMRLQAEQQRAEAEEQLQSVQRELDSKVSQAVQQATSQASTTVREVESWTKQEMIQLAAKLKTVVQSCSSHQQQVNLQMEALQQQWDNTSAAMELLQQEDRRVKKHLGRVQLQVEDLQHASQEAAAAAKGLQQLQADLQELALTQQQLLTRQEAANSTSSNCSRRVQELVQQLQQLDGRVCAQAADLTGLAESVLGCLSAARAHAATAAAAAAAAQPPSNYLSNLLGPAVHVPPPPAASAKQMPWAPWDEQLKLVDGLVTRLRRQQRASDFSSSLQQGFNSPSRPGLAPRSMHSATSPAVLASIVKR